MSEWNKNNLQIIMSINVSKLPEYVNEHADELLSVSNSIIVYDLIKNASKENVDESQIVGGK